MTLPFDMEVYTKQLVRSNSHNVESRESNSTSCRSINSGDLGHVSNAIPITKSYIRSCPESPTTILNTSMTSRGKLSSSHISLGLGNLFKLDRHPYSD